MKKKKVICLNDGQIFESAKKASDVYEIRHSSISNSCNGKCDYVSNEKRLVFMWHSDYIKMSKEEIEHKIYLSQVRRKDGYSGNAKKVVCLNDGKIFDCMKNACKFYEINNSSLSKHLNKHSKYSNVGGLKFEYYKGA